MHKIARIAFNSSDWRRPTGDARKHEAAKTYSHTHGFGHEEWLFRSEWQIDGWRYAFVQGVNKSRTKLLKSSQPFHLTLFTIQPDKRRRYVATIKDVECLDDTQAAEAVKVFKRKGWLNIMISEIKDVDGDVSGLGKAEYVTSVVNVRFRSRNVFRFTPETYAMPGDPILNLNRYRLFDAPNIWGQDEPSVETIRSGKIERKGSKDKPGAKSFLRRPTGAVECTPEHARMQALLMDQLEREYPGSKILREQDFIDVSLKTKDQLILFEIKSDLNPRSVIRQALGQLLEYAYHPTRKHPLPPQLEIVGRQPLSKEDDKYLEYLKTAFSLPLSYRVVKL
jgi:hypothetical protein